MSLEAVESDDISDSMGRVIFSLSLSLSHSLSLPPFFFFLFPSSLSSFLPLFLSFFHSLLSCAQRPKTINQPINQPINQSNTQKKPRRRKRGPAKKVCGSGQQTPTTQVPRKGSWLMNNQISRARTSTWRAKPAGVRQAK